MTLKPASAGGIGPEGIQEYTQLVYFDRNSRMDFINPSGTQAHLIIGRVDTIPPNGPVVLRVIYNDGSIQLYPLDNFSSQLSQTNPLNIIEKTGNVIIYQGNSIHSRSIKKRDASTSNNGLIIAVVILIILIIIGLLLYNNQKKGVMLY